MYEWTIGRIIRMVIRAAIIFGWLKLATVAGWLAVLLLVAFVVVVGALALFTSGAFALFAVGADVLARCFFRDHKPLITDGVSFWFTYAKVWTHLVLLA